MALIKNRSDDRLTRDAIVLDLSDLGRQAERMLERANAEAQRIIEEGREEAQRLIDQADAVGHKQGLERGIAEGREQGRTEGRDEIINDLKPRLEAMIESWSRALEQWQQDRNDMLLAAREDVLAFAFALGQKIVHRIVEVDPTVVEDQLAEALSLLTRPTALRVTIHPDDRQTAEDVLPELLERFSNSPEATLRDDASVGRGGCVVSTDGGSIDASIDAQLDSLAATLLPWTKETETTNASDGTG